MNLIDGIKKILDHNGILFLGSGFSTGGKNFNGQNMKTGAWTKEGNAFAV